MLKELKKKDIKEFLEKLGNVVEKAVTIYLIGGGNMTLRDLKDGTMDIDLVVLSMSDYFTIKKALLKMKYRLSSKDFDEVVYKTATKIFESGDSKVDIFVNKICHKLTLSKNMQKRSEPYKDSGLLVVKLVHPNDIFLFKLVADRERDVVDCLTLSAAANAKEVVKECKSQEKEQLFRFLIQKKIGLIEGKTGASLPKLKRKINKICNEWLFNLKRP